MAVVVYMEMSLGGSIRAGALPNGLAPGGIRDVPSESCFEGIPAPVGQERGHARRSKTRHWRVVEGIIPVIIFGIGIYALALGLAPADTPCAVLARCRDGNNGPNIILAEVRPFQSKHAAHRTADDGGYLAYSQVVQNQFMQATPLSALDKEFSSVSELT